MVQEQTGLICDDERPMSLAESIDRLLKDVELRNRCGEQALKRYMEHYSSAEVKSRWLTALRPEQ